MSDDMGDDTGGFFALPPFKADEALVQLRRQLRELRLQESSGGGPSRWTLKGLPVIELQLAPAGGKPAIDAARVQRPSQRPEWTRSSLDSSAAVRQWLDEFKRQLPRWADED
ncbi:MAG: hypothetical protein IIA02_04310 [Proteobacteria bacterium]|uniref:hypothetical protein n=1 Tax=Aquabacterium sp. TaxID=1872578 RepID=UPI0035C7004E|nr:hypothetical protein [Pseudomonadota bacterium]